jgi:hypothetical protein
MGAIPRERFMRAAFVGLGRGCGDSLLNKGGRALRDNPPIRKCVNGWGTRPRRLQVSVILAGGMKKDSGQWSVVSG